MKTIRIASDWDWPNIFRQSVGGSGVWDDIKLTRESIIEPDFLVILNRLSERTQVRCSKDRIWAIAQEPPIAAYSNYHLKCKDYGRIYTSAVSSITNNAIPSHPALCWHVNKSYDELLTSDIPTKTGLLSWVTSNIALLPTHIKRLEFLHKLVKSMDVALYGKGFNYIEDKWDALAPYKYSITVENHVNDYYWSEKIADCFLSWTMPIYYGCRRIDAYFPKESFVQIDIDAPDAIETVNEVINSDRWEKNIEAIAEARQLILHKYQLFPFLKAQIDAYCVQAGSYAGNGRATTDLIPMKLTSTLIYKMKVLHPRLLAKIRNISEIRVKK